MTNHLQVEWLPPTPNSMNLRVILFGYGHASQRPSTFPSIWILNQKTYQAHLTFILYPHNLQIYQEVQIKKIGPRT